MTKFVAVTTKLLQEIENEVMQEQARLGRKLTKKEREAIFAKHDANPNFQNMFNPNFYLH